MDKNSYEDIAISGLLHDIGKLFQRTDFDNGNHPQVGYDYILNFTSKTEILDGILCHHSYNISKKNINGKPIDGFAYIVYEADNIASGMERNEINDGEDNSFDKSAGLNNIFKYKDASHFDTVKSIDLHDISLVKEKYKTSVSEYNTLYDGTRDAIKKYFNDESIGSLLNSLEKYLSNVPSTTENNKNKDISLYDHMKMTGAISTCIYNYCTENNEEYSTIHHSTKYRKKDVPIYKLITGDFSGIQNFIYNIISENALKSLRGRSFYLEIFMENIIDELLNKLNLTRCNLLYSGGGHFYIISQNTENTEIILKEFNKNINKWLFNKYDTDLYLAMASTNTTAKELMDKCDDVFKRASEELSKEKLCKYQGELLEDIFKSNFEYNENERECKNCKSSKFSYYKDNDGNEEICINCNNLINLGSDVIKGNKAFVVSNKKPEGRYVTLPDFYGNGLYGFFDNTKKLNNDNKIYSINDNIESCTANIRLADASTETELIEYAKKSVGINRIGVLRADVDDLGKLFTSHFVDDNKDGEVYDPDKNFKTITRYATLSRKLSLFFKNYVNTMAVNSNFFVNGKNYTRDNTDFISDINKYSFDDSEKSRNISVIYAGGDDLFILGAWDEVLTFGIDVNKLYKKFSCGESHFSAGFGIYHPKYPIHKIAINTGELEECSKANYIVNNNEKKIIKNSITLFNEEHTYTWERLGELLKELNILDTCCYFKEEDKVDNKIFLSNSMIYKILILIRTDEEINLSRIMYTLARMEYNKKNEENYKKMSSFIINKYRENKKELKTILTLIVYLNRKKEDK